jgi:hypothetical protein
MISSLRLTFTGVNGKILKFSQSSLGTNGMEKTALIRVSMRTHAALQQLCQQRHLSHGEMIEEWYETWVASKDGRLIAPGVASADALEAIRRAAERILLEVRHSVREVGLHQSRCGPRADMRMTG